MKIKDHIDLNSIPDSYDAAVIGAGINGAGIVRDLALQGKSVILLDKKDLSSQTSSKSSKMLHGGIRYLENYDFDLVFEALKEKNLWLKLTPHLCYESRFYMPVYKDSIRPLWMIKLGLFLYDLLSKFEQTRHLLLNKKETIRDIPLLRERGLTGSGIYHDAVVDDYRLTIECLVDAKEVAKEKVQILNHTEANDFNFDNDEVTFNAKDLITGNARHIKANDIIFATGPFTDNILNDIPQLKWEDKLIASRGSHLWLNQAALNIQLPVVLTPKDGRVIFVIPQKNKVLVGTTEEEHQGDMFDIKASKNEIDYLLSNIEEYFDVELSDEDIISSFSGIRPLVKDGSGDNRGKTARNHKIYQPLKNCYVILGGKYTTFRVMAKEVCELVLAKRKQTYNSTLSKMPFRFSPYYFPFDANKNTEQMKDYILRKEFVRTEDDFKRRMN